MYIKNDYINSNNEDCKSCDNNPICKWAIEKTRIDKEILNIERAPLSPILIKCTCSHYKKINQRQDGFTFL